MITEERLNKLYGDAKFLVIKYFMDSTYIMRLIAIDTEKKNRKREPSYYMETVSIAANSFHYLAQATRSDPQLFDKELVEIFKPVREIYDRLDAEDRRPTMDEIDVYDVVHQKAFEYLAEHPEEYEN